MGLVILFILNIIVFILGVVLRLALYSAKISLSLLSVPVNASMKNLKALSKSKNTAVKAPTLAVYISLKALIALLNLLIIVIDIIFFLLSTLGMIFGFVVALLILTVIVAGAYILILNDCSVGSSSSSSSTTKQSSSGTKKAGTSETAGQGELTEEAKSWAKTWELTYIGDSLGAGSASQFQSAFPNAVYDSDPSRGLISIRGQQTGETAIATLKRLSSEGKVKENLVVAIGTNNDMSTEALQEFYSNIPSSVKTITWVLTASEGAVDNKSINSTIKNFVNSHDNMRYLDWKAYVDNNGGWSSYQGGDNVHMSQEGYSKYVSFQTQGLYDLYGGSGSSTKTKETARGGSSLASGTSRRGEISYIDGLFHLASSKVNEAIDITVNADDDKKKEKHGCNFSTSKVSSNDSKKSDGNSSGGSLAGDGTGSHNISINSAGNYYSKDELPDELKKYAIDPESIGMKYGAPWEGGISGPNSNGWIDFVGVFDAGWAGQCTELSASMLYNLWEKDGQHFINAQGNGPEVAGIVAQKTGAKVTKTPKAGAVFSEAGIHTGIVSHVFENGDILVIEQNTPKSGNTIGKPNTWNYRLIAAKDIPTHCGNGFTYLGDAGYKLVGSVKSVG